MSLATDEYSQPIRPEDLYSQVYSDNNQVDKPILEENLYESVYDDAPTINENGQVSFKEVYERVMLNESDINNRSVSDKMYFNIPDEYFDKK